MTQEYINKIFATPMGQQLYELFVTSDDRVFVRYSEAMKHSRDGIVITWYPEEPEEECDKSIKFFIKCQTVLNMVVGQD